MSEIFKPTLKTRTSSTSFWYFKFIAKIKDPNNPTRDDWANIDINEFSKIKNVGVITMQDIKSIIEMAKKPTKCSEMNTTELIINKALNIIQNNPFDYSDYDETAGLTLADALTVIVMDGEDHDTELQSDKVYDLINETIR